MTTSGTDTDTTDSKLSRLVGVYDADGTVLGELTYFVGARLGRRHCSLCDITHGLVRERSEWRSCRSGLSVPFDTYHRNDQPEEVRAALAGVTPGVVAETASGIQMLLGPDELDRCDGSVDALIGAVNSAVDRHGLSWPNEIDPSV